MEELMAKYLANELSEADSADFEHKLAADSNFNEEFEMSLLAWHESNESEDISFDSDKAWNIVSSKIGKTNTIVMFFFPTKYFVCNEKMLFGIREIVKKGTVILASFSALPSDKCNT